MEAVTNVEPLLDWVREDHHGARRNDPTGKYDCSPYHPTEPLDPFLKRTSPASDVS